MRGVTEAGTDPLLPNGHELRAFATAVVDRGELQTARQALRDAVGPEAAARAAAVAANFEMMNRVVDATGCPIPAGAWRLAGPLGLDVSG